MTRCKGHFEEFTSRSLATLSSGTVNIQESNFLSPLFQKRLNHYIWFCPEPWEQERSILLPFHIQHHQKVKGYFAHNYLFSLADRGEVNRPEYFSLNRLKSSLYFLFSACWTSLQKGRKKETLAGIPSPSFCLSPTAQELHSCFIPKEFPSPHFTSSAAHNDLLVPLTPGELGPGSLMGGLGVTGLSGAARMWLFLPRLKTPKAEEMVSREYSKLLIY